MAGDGSGTRSTFLQRLVLIVTCMSQQNYTILARGIEPNDRPAERGVVTDRPRSPTMTLIRHLNRDTNAWYVDDRPRIYYNVKLSRVLFYVKITIGLCFRSTAEPAARTPWFRWQAGNIRSHLLSTDSDDFEERYGLSALIKVRTLNLRVTSHVDWYICRKFPKYGNFIVSSFSSSQSLRQISYMYLPLIQQIFYQYLP